MANYGFPLFLRMARRSLAPGPHSHARLTFRRAFVLAVFLPGLFLLQLLHRFCFFLDDLFFRGYKDIEVREPVFIVGVPRSGTTFLHRLLARDGRFTTPALWELIFAPSVIQRKIIRGIARADAAVGAPLRRLMDKVERLVLGGLDDVHRTGLRDPEEDYLLFLWVMGCFILVLPFPFPEMWRLSRFDEDLPREDRERLMQFYRRGVQRHLYVHGTDKRYLSKNPSFSSLVSSLTETFPDSKIIGCVRNPYYTVPSLLSSMEAGARLFAVDPEGSHFREGLYAAVRHYYANLLDKLPQLPEDRYSFITLEELGPDPRAAVHGIYNRFGFDVAPQYDEWLREQVERSRKRKSKHEYTLEQFGFDPRIIQEDLADVYARFGFTSEYPT